MRSSFAACCLAALALLVVLFAVCASPARVEEAAMATVAAVSEGGAVDLAQCEDGLTVGDLPHIPPVIAEIAEHVRPVLSTDDSHDIPNAAASHDADLDREAAEGMAPLPRRTGAPWAKEQAAADLDQSIAAARARLRAPAGDAGR